MFGVQTGGFSDVLLYEFVVWVLCFWVYGVGQSCLGLLVLGVVPFEFVVFRDLICGWVG